MENVNPDSIRPENPEEIDRELHRVCSPEVGGVPRGLHYEAASLFAKMQKAFEGYPQRQALGFRGFREWAIARQETLGVDRSEIYEWARVGNYLLPLVGKEDLEKLGIMKARELARLAKHGKLTSEFVKDSPTMTHQVLRAKVNAFIGTESSWLTDVQVDSHEAAQAVLLELGKLLDYETYTADPSHPCKAFGDKTLGELATLKDLPVIGSEKTMESARRIDVVWLNEDNFDSPVVFFEVEHTTNVTSGLQRMFQVVMLNGRFFIVGPTNAQSRFRREIEKAPFRRYKDRYSFHTYEELRALFRAATTFRMLRNHFFAPL